MSRSLCGVFLSLFFAASSAGQTVAVTSVAGHVTDTTGSAVVNADLILVSDSGNYQRAVKSTTTGQFLFTDVPVGPFTLTARIAGFSEKIIKGVASPGEANSVNVSLEVKARAEQVTVEAESITLSPTWNAWFEESGPKPSFEPLEALATNTEYQLFVDLAAFAYKDRTYTGKASWKYQAQSSDPSRSSLLQCQRWTSTAFGYRSRTHAVVPEKKESNTEIFV
jgi:Carboxypeptidase regulatory-like domain